MGGFGPPVGSPFAGPGGQAQRGPAACRSAVCPRSSRPRSRRSSSTSRSIPGPDVGVHVRARRRRLVRPAPPPAPHRRGLVIAFALVWTRRSPPQAGPALTQIGIDDGVLAGDQAVLVVASVAYLVWSCSPPWRRGARVAVHGRLGERLMYELRVRAFSHLQRLSLDFFTDEGRPGDDEDDLGRRQPHRAAAGRAGEPGGAGPHPGSSSPACSWRSTRCSPSSPSASSCRPPCSSRSGSGGRRTHLRGRARPHRRRPRRSLGEPLGDPHQHGPQPAAPQRDQPPQRGGAYRDANIDTARRRPVRLRPPSSSACGPERSCCWSAAG